MKVFFKPIKPKTFNDKAMRQELETEMLFTSIEFQKEFQKLTAKWKKPPVFYDLMQVGPDSMQLLVGSDDPIFGYWISGTRPHLILPRNANVLRWEPKTGGVVYSAYAMHPGTKPNPDYARMVKDLEKRFKKNMTNAMRRARTASGYEI